MNLKKRKQKLARNMIVLGMINHTKGGAMKDKRYKRQKNPNKNVWSEDE